jgi:hypothetical protein
MWKTRFSEGPHLRPADVWGSPGWSGERELRAAIGDLPYVYGLEQKAPGRHHHGEAIESLEQAQNKAVELGGPEDVPRHLGVLDNPLGLQLHPVVRKVRVAVDADDGDEQDVRDARPAAWSRRRIPSTSTWRVLGRELEAQWIIVLTPSTASSRPSPVSRSPCTALARRYLLITRTSSPASLSRLTTLLPSEPVPPLQGSPVWSLLTPFYRSVGVSMCAADCHGCQLESAPATQSFLSGITPAKAYRNQPAARISRTVHPLRWIGLR